MSIAVGLLCENGIVLASDRKYQTNGHSGYGERIYPLAPRPWLSVVLAGAGSVGLVRAAADKINDALPESRASMLGVCTIIESTSKVFYTQYASPHEELGQGPDYGLLVAVCLDSEGFALLRATEHATVGVDGQELSGTGGIVSAPYKPLWRRNMPAFEAELAAIFMVKHAKTHDAENSGGETRVFSLFEDMSLKQLRDEYIKAAEDYFTHFTEFSLGMLLPADFGAELDVELFKGNARSLAEELGRRRIDLRRWHSHAYTW